MMTEVYGETLSKAIYNIDNTEMKKKQEEEEKAEKEESRRKLSKAKEEVELLKKEISTVGFNTTNINQLKIKVDIEIFKNSRIEEIRWNPKLSSQLEADRAVEEVHQILDTQIVAIEKDVKTIYEDAIKKANQIHQKLNHQLEKFDIEGLFKIGTIDFTKSVMFQDYLKVDSVGQLSSKILEETIKVRRCNPIKDESYPFYSFIKKFKQKKAPQTITEMKTVYDISFIEEDIGNLRKEFDKLYDTIIENGDEYIQAINKEVCARFDNIFVLMDDFKEELIRREDLIKKLVKDKEQAIKVKNENEVKIAWLSNIVFCIEAANS